MKTVTNDKKKKLTFDKELFKRSVLYNVKCYSGFAAPRRRGTKMNVPSVAAPSA